MALAAIGFTWAGIAHSVAIALCAFCLAAMGLWSTMGPFWALMTRTMAGTAAAAGVALITTLGGFGGFVGPYVTGRLREATHSFSNGLYAVAVLALGAALVSIGTRWLRAKENAFQ
jgi:ACS family tartrate transporter-like MFS transporter